ncbi:MAG: Gfo/Idh/MocA family protein [Thermoprotei archaeon]
MEIVVMGVRGFGRVHLNAIHGVDVSVMERDKTLAEEVLTQYQHKVKRVFSSIEEALSSSADAVDIVLPHNLHAPVAIEAMKMGKHVLVEKPIATSVQDAQNMIRIAKETGKKLMVADQWHFDPSVLAAKAVITEGKIGDLTSLIVRSQGFYDASGWRRSEKDMGGGALIDGGIHYVDTMLSLGGDYSDVYGAAVKGGSAISGEDTSAALFRFKKGAVGLLFYSWGYRNPPVLPEFEVIGSSGSVYEDPLGELRNVAGGDYKGGLRENTPVYRGLIVNGQKYPVKGYDPVRAEIDGFLKSVEEGTEVPFDPSLAKRELEAVLSIYGRPV